jgi:hypothetical protein
MGRFKRNDLACSQAKRKIVPTVLYFGGLAVVGVTEHL